MILRLMVLMGCGAVAYVLLKGWPGEMPALVRDCVALLILLAGVIAWSARGGKADDQKDGDVVLQGGRKPGWMDYGLMGMALLALECGFLWVLSAAPEPLERVAVLIEERFFQQDDGEGLFEEASGSGVVGGNWVLDGEEDMRELPRRVNLKLGSRPEVFVRLLREEDVKRFQGEQIYLRAFVLDDYVNGVWRARAGAERLIEADGNGWIREGSEMEGEIAHEVYHGKDGTGRNYLTAIQGVRAVRLPGLRQMGEDRYFLSDSGDERGYRYFASSKPMMLRDFVGVDWEVAERDGGDKRLRDLVKGVAGQGGIVERLLSVERYLRENFEYSLVVKNADDLEPMENFLYGERRGHCEYFATAGALMARELGVESRVAYGWAAGEYLEARSMYVFRARDAHAWVEVKVPGYGWVVMEPTPSNAFRRAEEEKEKVDEEKEPELSDLYDEYEAADDGSKKGEVSGLYLMVAGGCVFGAGILVMLRRRVLKGQGGEEGEVLGGDGEAMGYVSAWRMAVAKRGGAGRGRTMRNEVRSLGEKPEFAGDMVDYHYGVVYGGKERDRDQEKGLERRIAEWR